MKVTAFLAFAALVSAQRKKTECNVKGARVNVSGIIMDNFCINRGTLLDIPSIRTLENPAAHTIHCLIEVPQCINSGYAILAPPKNPGGLYSVAYQLGSEGTGLAFDAGIELRGKGARSNLSLSLTGIDDGTDTLKCIQLQGSSVSNSFVVAPIKIEKFQAAHGALMFVAWYVLVPIGIMIARFFKHIGHRWYIYHSICMSLAALCTITSGVIIFAVLWPTVTFQATFDPILLAHAYIGILVIGLGAFAMPVLGKLADYLYKPERSSAPVFPDRVHAWLGRLVGILAFINIWLGVIIFDTRKTVWIAVGVILAVIYIVAFIFLQIRRKRDEGQITQMDAGSSFWKSRGDH